MSVRCPVLRLVEASPPLALQSPVSVAEIKTHLRLPEYSPPDTSEDAYIQSLIWTALEEAEAKQNRDITPRVWELTLYAPDVAEGQLRAETESVLSVMAYDSAGEPLTSPAPEWILDEARSRIVFRQLPGEADRVVIRHKTKKLSPLPETLRAGIVLLAGWLYQQRLPGATFAKDALGSYPFAIERLLRLGAFHCAAVL